MPGIVQYSVKILNSLRIAIITFHLKFVPLSELFLYMHSEVNVLEWHDWHLHCTCCSMYCAFVTALGCWFSDSLTYQARGSTEDSRCGCLWELVDTKKRNSYILTVVSRNLDSKTSKVWDCFLETARRGDYKKNLLRLALVLLAIYSSRGFIPYAGKNSAIAFYFFFPLRRIHLEDTQSWEVYLA